jgi:hypothetical protein
MTKLTKIVHELFSDESAATNNYNLHTEPPILFVVLSESVAAETRACCPG